MRACAHVRVYVCVYVRVNVIKTLNQLNDKIKLKNSKNFVAKTRFLRSKVALNLVCLDKVFKLFFSSYIIVLKLTFSFLFIFVIRINIQTYCCGIHRPLYFRAKPLAGKNYHPRVANALKTAYFASSFFAAFASARLRLIASSRSSFFCLSSSARGL